MKGTTGTTNEERHSHATLRRLGTGSVLAVALLAAGASPAFAGTGHQSGAVHGAHTSTRVSTTKGTRIARPVAVKLGPAVSITRTLSTITIVR